MSKALRQQLEEIIALSDEEYTYILSHFKTRKLKKHQFAVQEGGSVEQEYFVVSGLLKASFTSEEGKEHIIQYPMKTN
jgi:CRP-like cAMP-binding protein